MIYRWLVVAILSSCTISTFAEEPRPAEPEGEPRTFLEKAELEHWIKNSTAAASPRFGVVTVIDKERGVFVITEKMTTAVKEHRAVVIFGDERREQPVVKFIIATTQYRYALEESPVYDVNGKKVNKEDALKRLQVGRAVVLSSDGKMVDARYCGAMQQDTLILIPPIVQPIQEQELQP